MEWHDEGLILGTRKHGEASVIVEAMMRAHGRCFGLVRGGRPRPMQSLLQAGTKAEFVWRARLDEHLGTFVVEPVSVPTALMMASAEALHAVCHVAALLRQGAERDPHPELYEAAAQIAGRLDKPQDLASLMVHFEAEILAQMGFGLDLSVCAATGSRTDLIYVSPKSGRAVSKAAGEPYKARLLPLPAFLLEGAREPNPPAAEICDGFRLTGFFLMRDLFEPRGQTLPDARSAYLAAFVKRLGAAA
ncbi:MAG TPA: DNA repair protein RecO [Methylocella sp.]|nr:DNA repair protein RecO [Methylocella sp.]